MYKWILTILVFLFVALILTKTTFYFFLFSIIFLFIFICYFFTNKYTIFILFTENLNIVSSPFLKCDFDAKRCHTCGPNPSFENEIASFTHNICRDYIHSWFKDISANPQFTNDCNKAIQAVLKNLFSFLCLIDTRSTIVEIFRFLSNFPSDFESHLTFLTPQKESILVKSMLDKLLNLTAQNWLEILNSSIKLNEKPNSDLVYLMILDLLTNAAFLPIIDIISDPAWLNMIILNYLDPTIDYQYQLGSSKNDTEHKQSTFSYTFEPSNLESKYKLSLVSLPCSSSSKFIESRNRSISELGSSLKKVISAEDVLKSRSLSQGEVELCEPGIDIDLFSENNVNLNLSLFTNIRITKTYTITNDRETFTVYFICLSALYEELDSNPNASCTERVNSKLVRRTIEVKRRFREFVKLQYLLEDNSKLRQYIIDLKKPSRLRLFIPPFSMSFSKFKQQNMDKNIIEFRRKFLEDFLNELCSISPICESVELQNFLNYRNESSYAVIKSLNSVIRPIRIDRMVVRRIRDAFTFLRTALPPDSPQDGIFAPGPSLYVSDSYEISFKLMKTTYDCSKFDQMLSMVTHQSPVLTKDKNLSSIDSQVTLNKYVVDNHKPNLKLSNQFLVKENSQYDQDKIPLTTQTLNILWIYFFNKVSFWHHFLSIIKYFLGQKIEKILIKIIDNLILRHVNIYLLHQLHESLWPDKKKDDYKASQKLDAVVFREVLIEKIVSKFPFQIFKKHIRDRVERLVSIFQSKQVNKLFIYSLFNDFVQQISQCY